MLSESRFLPPPLSRLPWPACSMLSLPGNQGWQLPDTPGSPHSWMDHWLLCCEHRLMLKEHGRFCTMSSFRDHPLPVPCG